MSAQNEPKWINFIGNNLKGGDIDETGDTLWVGFDGGLTLIDKPSRRVIAQYNSANSEIKGNLVNSLATHHSGKAWFVGVQTDSLRLQLGGNAPVLKFFDGEKFTDPADNMEVLVGKKSISNLLVSNSGIVYFTTFYNTTRYEIWKLENYHLEKVDPPGENKYPKAITIDSNNRLICSYSSGEIAIFENKNWTVFDVEPVIGAKVSTNSRIIEDPNGSLYFKFEYDFDYHLVRLKDGQLELLNEYNYSPNLYFSPQGEPWIRGRNALIKLDNDWELTNTEHRLPEDFTIFLWEDSFNFWGSSPIDGESGIFYLTSDNQKEYIPLGNCPLSSNNIQNVNIGSSYIKEINAGTDLITFDGSSWDTLNKTPLDNFHRLYAFSDTIGNTYYHEDQSNATFYHFNGSNFNELFVGSFSVNHCLIKKDGDFLFFSDAEPNYRKLVGSSYETTSIPAIRSDVHTNPKIDNKGNIWSKSEELSSDHILFQWNVEDSTLNEFNLPGFGFNSSDPDLFIDKQQNIYLGYNLTIFVFDQDSTQWKTLTLPDSIYTSNRHQHYIDQDSKGTIWIGTKGGLFRFDGKEWRHILPHNSGLPYHEISDLAIDQYDNIWIGTQHGLGVFNENGIKSMDRRETYNLGGRVYFDVNDDKKFEPRVDMPVYQERVLFEQDSINLYTDEDGNYGLNVQRGTHNIELVKIKNWTAADSLNRTVNIANASIQDLDFRIIPEVVKDSVRMFLTGDITRCDLSTTYYLGFKNTGTTIFSGRIVIQPDTLITFLNGEPNLTFDSINNEYFYDFVDFLPFEFNQLKMRFPTPDFNHIGKTLNWKAHIYKNENNSFSKIDSTSFQQIIRCSYDPNDKLVQSSGEMRDSLSLLKDYLRYTVRFQNTGNDTAFRVEIIDTLSQNLDLSTFKVLQSSHEVETQLRKGGIVHFIFKNIQLPDSTTNLSESNGFVQFEIKSKSDLIEPLQVSNKAYIYFDRNPPIITNTAVSYLVTEFPTSSIRTVSSQPNVKFYPNPNRDGIVNIEFKEPLKEDSRLSIFDNLGKKISEFEIKRGLKNYQFQIDNNAQILIVKIQGTDWSLTRKLISIPK